MIGAPYIAGGVGLAVLIGLLAFQNERHSRQAAEAERDQVRAELIAAQSQSTLNQAAGSKALQAESRAVNVTIRSQEAAHVVQAAPGASEAIPEPVRLSWLSGLRGLREPADPAAAANDPGGGEPAGQVPVSAGG